MSPEINPRINPGFTPSSSPNPSAANTTQGFSTAPAAEDVEAFRGGPSEASAPNRSALENFGFRAALAPKEETLGDKILRGLENMRGG